VRIKNVIFTEATARRPMPAPMAQSTAPFRTRTAIPWLCATAILPTLPQDRCPPGQLMLSA
jgi:hypothetical protein